MAEPLDPLAFLRVTTPRHLKIATEGALSASVLRHGVSNGVQMTSDPVFPFTQSLSYPQALDPFASQGV